MSKEDKDMSNFLREKLNREITLRLSTVELVHVLHTYCSSKEIQRIITDLQPFSIKEDKDPTIV